jgi:hypothetical protein
MVGTTVGAVHFPFANLRRSRLMRKFIPILIAAAAIGLPAAAAMAQYSTVQRSYVRPYTSGYARGLPGVANPGSINVIVPLKEEDVTVGANAGGGGN